jgi:ABC-type polysaccharide/polyol phosphate export permease
VTTAGIERVEATHRPAAPPQAPPALRSPSRGVRRVVAETWSRRELLGVVTWREVRTRYKSSALGLVWSLLNPLLLLVVYWFLFEVIFPFGGIPDFPVFMLLGLIAWIFFAGALTTASVSFIGNAAIVTRVAMPRQVIPLSQVLTQGVNFLISFVLVIPFLVIAQLAPQVETIQVIPVLVLFLAFTVGLSLLVACATVFWRDVEHLLNVVLFPLFFATPILWDFTAQGVDGLTGKLLFFGNPVTPYISAFRTTFYDPQWIDGGIWTFMVLAAAASLAAGLWVCSRLYDEIATEL